MRSAEDIAPLPSIPTAMQIARILTATFLAAAAGAILTACAQERDTADTPGSITVAGVQRTYVAHVPPHLGPSVPLVLSFHGHFGTGAGQSRLTRFDVQSDAFGFIVVYPNGIKRGWNDGRTRNKGDDDIAFVKALIADFSRRYPIDPKRIYATGFSNGATFTQYLGCMDAGQIAAIAPVSGSLPSEDAAECRPARPLPVLEIGGTADPIMPFAGGEITLGKENRGGVLSAQRTIQLWAANARCKAPPSVAALAPIAPNDGTSVTLTRYATCAT